MALIARTSEFSYSLRRKPPTLAQAGDLGVACSPTKASLSAPRPLLPGALDSGEPF